MATLLVGEDHRILAASRQCTTLLAGESLLGRRCYEVLHRRQTPCGRNVRRCPLRYVRESGEPCRVVHVHHAGGCEVHHEISVRPVPQAGVPARLEIRPVKVASPEPCPCRLVGRSQAFSQMLELLLRAASRETPVLILGEPGTCRETVARALHRLGGKRQDHFGVIHCPGLCRESLAEELAVLTAPAGDVTTLYLDEVDALGSGGQGELLGRLKAADRRVTGGPRLICAGRPDLRARVTRGDFLDDLYYRVNVFPIPVPTLRERREDLPILAECLLAQIEDDRRRELHPRALAVLERYPFPGNLRELYQILEYACLKAASRRILPEDLPAACHR